MGWEKNPIFRSNEIAIFTDGSKTEERTGSGIFSGDPELRVPIRLPDTSSVFQSEVLGVFRAVELMQMRSVSERDIATHIYIDCQAVLKAMDSTNINSDTVRGCRTELKVLCSQNRVRLCWMPGHCGMKGNEQADELARKGGLLDNSEVANIKSPICIERDTIEERITKTANIRS